MFVSRVVVSLRVPGLEKKSLVKITSLVYNCRMVEVYAMAKLVRVLRNFGIVISKPNRSFLFYAERQQREGYSQATLLEALKSGIEITSSNVSQISEFSTKIHFVIITNIIF